MTVCIGYQEFRRGAASCEACGWSGKGSDTAPELKEEVVVEHACPECSAKLALSEVPAMGEKLGTLGEEERPSPYLAALLRSPDQLPELEEAELKLHFDVEEVEGEPAIVLRHGKQELWREPGYFECYRRFGELVGLLRQRYGERLRDVAPTTASREWLYGESLLHAQHAVQEIRDGLSEHGSYDAALKRAKEQLAKMENALLATATELALAKAWRDREPKDLHITPGTLLESGDEKVEALARLWAEVRRAEERM